MKIIDPNVVDGAIRYGADDVMVLTPTRARVDHDGSRENGVRVYNSRPFTISLQVRSFGPTASKSQGKDRAVFAHADLSIEQAEALIKVLEAQVARSKEGAR